MLKNYIKLTWKMMMRRKAFTSITLIVIALYLMMVSTFATFSDLAMNNYAPEVHKLRTLQIGGIAVKNDEGNYVSNGQLSTYALEEYISKLETPEKIAWLGWVNLFNRGDHEQFMGDLINATFWELLELDFLEGRPFTAEEIANKDQVCVITEKMRKHFFGNETAYGKTLDFVSGSLRVVGVIETIHSFSAVNTDVFIPYTLNGLLNPEWENRQSLLNGNFKAFLLAESYGEFEAIQTEYENLVQRLDAEYAPKQEEYLVSEVQTPWEYASFIGSIPIDVMIILSFLFLALPASSLLNINVSRILERYSEIGIRKAFGASSGKLVRQFLVENIIFSILGGFLGFILTWIMLNLFILYATREMGVVFPDESLVFNWRVFLAMLLFSTFYGLATGVYPAWRMSKVPPIKALKGG